MVRLHGDETGRADLGMKNTGPGRIFDSVVPARVASAEERCVKQQAANMYLADGADP
ncbi:MAG: hypothetical protein J0L51_03175 [Rhizobiales bacterium]|nr:hypothetical protein [Hyphomicrobiales bacterium]